MGLGKSYWDRSNSDRDEAGSPHVATLRRDYERLPTLDAYEPRTRRRYDDRYNDRRSDHRNDRYGDERYSDESNDDEQELNEFREFFTTTRPDLATRRAPQGHPARHQSRLARVTERVGHVAKARPEVRLPRLPWNRHEETEAPSATAVAAEEARGRRLKLPPMWVLANLGIVLAMLIGFAPQIITVSAEAGCQWYTVRRGDTLWKISQQTGKTINGIAAANHIQNVDLIYVDQRLCIPMTPIAKSSTTFKPTTTRPPATSAPGNVKAFINFTLPYAKQASKQTGWPVSMILAQWGLETGWRVKTFTGYNWGNCGAMPGQPMIGGTSAPGSPAAFAYAYTPAQGVTQYVHVAHLRYYTSVAPAARTGGADAAARALGRSPWDWGHYTNRNTPGSSILAIMQRYNLYWYDTH
ncbi:MAG TPA: LysM peptidoglycan-binding domain-containing protein [Ktedonobacterales bacterium]|nr:LysM peptidoglycan-binding domain-containing protein [Ktedonobacterales bacterium]